MFFRKRKEKKTYDKDRRKPVIRVSICTGEQTAGFQDLINGHFEEVMLIRDSRDLEKFKDTYGITSEIEKIY